MKPGPKELRQRELAERKRIQQYHRAPYALTRAVTPALYGDDPIPKPRPQVRRNENPAKVPPKNKGGRPKKANALSNVERQRAYRARLKEAKA